jgi:hypothetical protein
MVMSNEVLVDLNNEHIRLGSVIFSEKGSDISYIQDPVSGSNMGFFIAKITPKLAIKILENNHDNQRRVRNYIVNSYKEAIISGLWKSSNGESIKFSNKNKLIDGQHRLLAIEKSKKTIYILVITGIEDSNIRTIDNGLKRSLSDVLRLNEKAKYKINLNSFSAFINYFHYSRQIAKRKDSNITVDNSQIRLTYKLSTSQALNLYDNLPNIDNTVAQFTNIYNSKIQKRIPQSIAFLMYYLFNNVNSNVTFTILKTLETGVPFDSDKGAKSPSFLISEWIVDKKIQGIRLSSSDYISAFIWAFEKTIKGEDASNYKGNKKYAVGIEHIGCDQIYSFLAKIKY